METLTTDGGPFVEIQRPTQLNDPRTVPVMVSRRGEKLYLNAGLARPADGFQYLGYYTYDWRGATAQWHPADA